MKRAGLPTSKVTWLRADLRPQARCNGDDSAPCSWTYPSVFDDPSSQAIAAAAKRHAAAVPGHVVAVDRTTRTVFSLPRSAWPAEQAGGEPS